MDISKDNIKLMASQNLDDTSNGGGQMTAIEIVDGTINNLYPDISRLDRVYGNVSLRKAYGSVQTPDRATYYGAHAVLTKQVDDPNVSVCFFSSNDYFDVRSNAKTRIESYLVQGPFYPAALYGNHYVGSRQLQLQTSVGWAVPSVGSVLVLTQYPGLVNQKQQFVRVTDVSSETITFTASSGSTSYNFYKQIINLRIGNALLYDFTGEEIIQSSNYATVNTGISTTVAADASVYYGVSTLAEAANIGEFQVSVENINVHLVPSAQSETAITDAGVGQAVAPLLQTKTPTGTITRSSISYSITTGSKLFIGEGILPGTLSWTGGITLTDDSKGNVYNGSLIVGTIDYTSGVITFGSPGGTYSGTGSITYTPACDSLSISDTGAIVIDIGTRGYSYVYNCNPIPKKGTLKIEFISNGQWYTIWDKGDGSLSGNDPAIGSGSVNFISGSVSMTFGAMPDVGSMVLLFWAKDAPFYDLSGESLGIKYSFTTNDQGLARGALKVGWDSDTVGVMDDSNGNMVVASITGSVWTLTATVVGSVQYATGAVEFAVHSSQAEPSSTGTFHVMYNFGVKSTETFTPTRVGSTVEFTLSNTPVNSGTVLVTFDNIIDPALVYGGTDPEGYAATSLNWKSVVIQKTPNFQRNLKDDSSDVDINYTTGEVSVSVDCNMDTPLTKYIWGSPPLVGPYGTSYVPFSTSETKIVSVPTFFPVGGTVTVSYTYSTGATAIDYYVSIPKKFYIKEGSGYELVPGSVKMYAGSTYIRDIGNGFLYTSVSGLTGIGTLVGTINYVERSVTITSDTFSSRTLTITYASGTTGIDPVAVMVFRTPSAPIRVSSLGIRATRGDGTVLIGTSDGSGNITGTGIKGTVNYNTGVCLVSFGELVTDTWALLDPDDQPFWYNSDLVYSGQVWKPYSVSASTVLINCVVTSYLPLDATLLGLDPVRLPLDGKVPIFRNGNILLIHNTQQENLTNPIIPGNTYTLARGNVNLIEIYDTPDPADPAIGYITDVPEYVPDGGNYTVDLVAGTVTFNIAFNPSAYRQPFIARTRIEDMVLASDVQITGHIAITNALTHNYPAGTTQVSSVLPIGNLQSRAYNQFTQATWTSVWSDSRIGSGILANYDFVNYPIIVTNEGAIKERWLILFQTSTTVQVVGEKTGVLVTGFAINASTDLEIINTLTSKVMFKFRWQGFGSGWAAGNCIRWNTDAANFPYWFVRTTLQAPVTEPFDFYEFQQRGDSA